MAAYIVRRLLYTIPIVLGVVMILFLVFNVVGGNPARAMLGKHATKKQVRDLEHELGLDLPLLLNVDAWRAPGAGRAALDVLAELEASGPLTAAQPDREVVARFVRLDDDPRAAIPALLAVLLEPATPEPRRAWANAALVWVTGERVPYDTGGDPASRATALDRWRAWWESRASRPAYAPAWGNLLQSQACHFLWQALTFDFGRSIQRKQSILEMIRRGAGPSLMITIPGFALSVIVALGLALLCAFYRGSVADQSLVVVSVLGMSVTFLAYVIAGQYILAYQMGLFPIHGYRPPYWTFVVLPVLIFVASATGPDVRFFRTVLLDEVSQDYVRTARAKGLTHSRVMLRHVLKNAMIPIITYTVIFLPFMFLGSLLLERFFGIPGLGSTMVDAIFSADWPVVRAFTYIGALLYIFGNLATDVCYALVDPRISLK